MFFIIFIFKYFKDSELEIDKNLITLQDYNEMNSNQVKKYDNRTYMKIVWHYY